MSKSITGVVTATKRVGTSASGNPTFDVTILEANGRDSVHRTVADSSLAYAIENSEYRDTTHEFGLDSAGHLDGTATPQGGQHGKG